MIGTRRPIAIAVTVAVGTAALALGCGGSLTKPDAGTAGIGGAPIMTGGAGASGAAGAGFAGADAAVDSRLDSYPITNCGGTRGVTATTGSCTYVLAEPAPAGDIARVFVFVSGLQVPMDPTRTNGWDLQRCLDVGLHALRSGVRGRDERRRVRGHHHRLPGAVTAV